MTIPDPRHRAIEVIERHLQHAEIPAPSPLARSIVLTLEAAGLTITDTPAPALGRCDIHWQPHPCHGCAADAKAAPDQEPP